jgi:hypothetical protein
MRMPVPARVAARAATLLVVLVAACGAATAEPRAVDAAPGPASLPAPHLSRVRGDITGGFQVSPPRVTDSLPAGGSRDYSVTVLNQSGHRSTFSIEVFDLAPGTGASYADLVDRGAAERGAGTWVTVSRPTVVLDNLQQAEVPFRVLVPVGADAGGHYAAIRVTSSAPADGSDVRIEAAIVEHVVVIVPGKVRYDLATSDVHVDRLARGHTTVSFTVRNRGNIHSSPSARVRLRGPLVDADATTDLPELLPGGRRKVSMTLRGLPLLGVGRVTVQVAGEDGRERSRDVGRVVVWSRAAVGGGLVVLVLLVGALVAWRRSRDWRNYLTVESDEDDRIDEAEAARP